MSIFGKLVDIVETAAPYVAPLIPGAGPLVQAASTAEITRRAQKTAVQAAQAVSAPTAEQAPEFAMETPMSGGLVSTQGLSVTRKQQHQLKQMVMYLGIEGAADVLNLNVRELAMLLVKKFPPRRKGISAAQLRNAKRVNRTIMGMAKQLTDSCKTTTRRR